MSTKDPTPDIPDEPDEPDEPEKPRTPRAQQPPRGRGSRGAINRLWWVLGAILLAIIVVPSFMVELITDWMWFGSQNLDAVYTTRLWLAVGVFFAAAFIGGLLCASNWIIAWR